MGDEGGRFDTVRGNVARRTTLWLAAFLVAAAGSAAAGILLVAALGRQGSPLQWSTWGDVGESFGAISAVFNGMALTAVIVTFWLQHRELRTQRGDLQQQRESFISAVGELHRSAEVDLRRLHLEILRLSMDDPDLAEVWPSFGRHVSAKRNKQYLYANAIYSYQLTALSVGGYTDADILEHFRYLFTSPLMREYWQAAKIARQSLVVGSAEYVLAQQIDRLCQHYNAATSFAADRNGRVPFVEEMTGQARSFEGEEPRDKAA
jgi:hypothetical protein